MKKNLYILFTLLLALTACEEKIVVPTDDEAQQQERTREGVNYFAANCMSVYYLWIDEIESQVNTWLNRELKTADPFEKVKSLRYKQGGKDYDRWTEILEDFETTQSSMEGVSTTYGCDVVLMRLDATYICAVVTVVYAGSPAEKAGLRRGDTIVRIGGKAMTKDNYVDLVTKEFLNSPSCSITLADPATGRLGATISMTATTMYEDPVVYHSVFDVGGKKVGYLVFTSFTLRAIDDLLAVFEQFRIAHVSELILDLRYNGGGYVTTEEALASMMAPLANVEKGDVFEQDIYNKTLTQHYGEDALKSRFKTTFTWKDGSSIPSTTDTRSGHLDLDRVYAIISSRTASASESLLVGLMPYLPVTLIGEQSHGKFCTGILYGAQDWYDDFKDQLSANWYGHKKDVEGWGLYVMIGRYADCNGKCPAMPDGLKPNYPAEDAPDLGYDFGDERDPMLRQALILAGRTDLKTASTRAPEAPSLEKMPLQLEKPSFGKRILTKR